MRKNPAQKTRPKKPSKPKQKLDWTSVLGQLAGAITAGDDERALQIAGAALNSLVAEKSLSREAALGVMTGLKTVLPALRATLSSRPAPVRAPEPPSDTLAIIQALVKVHAQAATTEVVNTLVPTVFTAMVSLRAAEQAAERAAEQQTAKS